MEDSLRNMVSVKTTIKIPVELSSKLQSTKLRLQQVNNLRTKLENAIELTENTLRNIQQVINCWN